MNIIDLFEQDKSAGTAEQGGTPKRNTKRRAWAFTWNNYTEEDIQYLLKVFNGAKYIFGEEVGTQGTPHLQGSVRFKNPRCFNGMRKLLKENRVEPCKNWHASTQYCSKDGKTFTNIKRHKTRKQRLLDKYYTEVRWHPWQNEILEIIEKDNEPRHLYWYWEQTGNVGKSFLAKYLVLKHDAVIATGKKDNVFNQINNWLNTHNQEEDPKVIIVDVPRYNLGYINYGMLEEIKGGLLYSGKYEGGVCPFDYPHMIIFANQEPDVSMMSKDRWIIKKIV